MNTVIRYYSGFEQPVLCYRLGAGAFHQQAMKKVGAGRTPSESLWEAEFPADSRSIVQFFFSDESGRDPRRRYYETGWRLTYVCDGGLYNYQPHPEHYGVSPSQRAYDHQDIPEFFSEELQRWVRYRVYLPRGYRHHSSKTYPVLYMLDGQNIFDDSGFGSWGAKETLDRLIRRGQIPELIVVAVDSGSTRYQDYVPPEDGGQAHLFAHFLARELKPFIDEIYRTKPEPESTGILGSSLGGLMSFYTAWNYCCTFSRVGSMSGSWWLDTFRDSLSADSKRPITVYLDSGASGHAKDCVHHTLTVRDILEELGYRLGNDLHHGVTHHHQHNEAAWSRRLPGALRFLFPAA